jgi:hypothetical protein
MLMDVAEEMGDWTSLKQVESAWRSSATRATANERAARGSTKGVEEIGQQVGLGLLR